MCGDWPVSWKPRTTSSICSTLTLALARRAPQGADTLKSDALSHRAVALPHWVSIGLLLYCPSCSQSSWVMQKQPNADPMGRWAVASLVASLLPRRRECSPSLNAERDLPAAGAPGVKRPGPRPSICRSNYPPDSELPPSVLTENLVPINIS